ncbi:sel1 repeat family protein [Pseudomonas sp. C2L11]|nr:sel1 repeat family protein [Pseudomonas typographi]
MVLLLRPQRMPEQQLRELLTRNPQHATRWIATAARADLPAAQVVWAQLLLEGRGVERDPAGAFTWFAKAAAAGDIEACNMLGRCYEQGWGVPANPKLATDAFEIAALAGHAWGRVNLAQMLMRAGDPADRPRCFALFQAVAEGGASKPHLKAMNSLARLLEEGWGTTPDPVGAARWYLKAARLGDHWAQYNLATILFRQGDEAMAERWLRSAIAISDNGFRRRITPLLLARSEPALRQIGLEALECCAQGNAPDDLYAYGVALEEGIAGARDPAKAAALLQAAADQGHAQARRRIQSKSIFAAVGRWVGNALPGARHFAKPTALSNNTQWKHR